MEAPLIRDKAPEMIIPPVLLKRIDDVIAYVGVTTSDYLAVKRQLINNFPSSLRSLFSLRHYSTKKQILNEFDAAVIAYWEKQTGVKLEIDPKKLHNPEWKQKKKGWALVLLNEERRKRRDKQKQKNQPR